MFDRRITVFTGHFGSGKTEVSVNYAFQLARRGKKTAIVDMDIVNPFFRTVDAKSEMEEKGIKVVAPIYANTNVDVPALPAEINALFEDKSYTVVLDVGGDDLGARVLSRYNSQIVQDDYVHYFVVNTKRPMTQTADEIAAILSEIEGSSRLKVDGLVNNANLLGATTPEILEEGAAIIEEASNRLAIPVGFISGMEETLQEYKGHPEVERLYLEKFIKLPWDRG